MTSPIKSKTEDTEPPIGIYGIIFRMGDRNPDADAEYILTEETNGWAIWYLDERKDPKFLGLWYDRDDAVDDMVKMVFGDKK